MFGLREGSCFPRVLVGVNVGLALVDGIIAFLAFYQLIRIHLRNSQLGWTRQKLTKACWHCLNTYFCLAQVFHLLIGSSNLGKNCLFPIPIHYCLLFFVVSESYKFCFAALPEILFFAAFLLLLSFWVDLCHQADDEDEEDEGSFREALLEKTFSKPNSLDRDSYRNCFPLRFVHIGSRQRIVIMVTVLVFVIMIASAVIIWIGMGKNSIDSALVARVWKRLLLCLRMRNVRSERASSEMWKVACLAVVSILCFTSSSFVALLTDIPVRSSIPSALVLWVVRELPPSITANIREEPSTITFVSGGSTTLQHPQSWTAAMSLRNQVQISRASPI
ncbi:hypothetical protein DVH24_017458 [Malus domestica]|uniref:THH1/TOM1/TOM3 domain-containing protein n=1 Tax=Malus domestica TaxID=3750 RepID=A0A498IVV8_MALDO|nr:hypothetical protein DVH24_017458 [Malus domestica]